MLLFLSFLASAIIKFDIFEKTRTEVSAEQDRSISTSIEELKINFEKRAESILEKKIKNISNSMYKNIRDDVINNF